MCGVIGFISERHREDLGRVAAGLLRTLEYRGYDSTGAAVQAEDDEVVLRKGVGAPSVMVERLGIVDLSGSILCGQVRWATFGSVDAVNAQPHEVRCHAHLYGAHNGNVTNCDSLKVWLRGEGHRVVSDNDGEMLVHAVEHVFAERLAQCAAPVSQETRRRCMRLAILEAAERLHGSYAAVVVDPTSRTLWAVKQGSSLYFGIGRDSSGSRFSIASSDLSSVLSLTRVLVPLREGEMVEFTASAYQVYALGERRGHRPGEALARPPLRSRLQAKDAALLPGFSSYMEQEIAAQADACQRVAALFARGSEASQRLLPWVLAWLSKDRTPVTKALRALRDEFDDERIQERFRALLAQAGWQELVDSVPPAVRDEGTDAPPAELGRRLVSLEAGLFTDLLAIGRTRDELFSVRLLDVIVEQEEKEEFERAVTSFVSACQAACRAGGRIFFLCCGSSYHAALGGAVLFNEIARLEIVPVLPGEFRGRYARTLRAADLLVAVSQSGETKDLIDVVNQVIETGLPIRRIAVVNNVSSTLPQEKCDTVLPLRCGPEIAVPATKSYLNQLAVFHGLALELGRARLAELPTEARADAQGELDVHARRFFELPRLVRETLAATEDGVEEAARLLHLAPSLHVLATRLLAVAKEGALKIREVVLNHAEGFEASEFKHGPNTILGVDTVFGIEEVLRYGEAVRAGRADALRELRADYPLIFVTGPDPRDIDLTVSQINTHKIRGTSCIVIAEEQAALRQAVAKPPADNPGYRYVFIRLPATGDNLAVLFSATVVLQRLALRMSLAKAESLDRLGFEGHGVHPDVPKNVSKSITVD